MTHRIYEAVENYKVWTKDSILDSLTNDFNVGKHSTKSWLNDNWEKYKDDEDDSKTYPIDYKEISGDFRKYFDNNPEIDLSYRSR